MKTFFKRNMAFLLAFLMMISVVPQSAYAVNGEQMESQIVIQENGVLTISGTKTYE